MAGVIQKDMQPELRRDNLSAPLPRWIVSQIGSRELYAAPLGFHRRERLERFYTDIWCRFGSSLFERLPNPLGAFGGRFHPELPGRKVTAFSVAGINYLRRQKSVPTVADKYLLFNEIGKWFASNVRDDLSVRLRRGSLDPSSTALFAFSTGALETLTWARDHGLFSVVDQLDPARMDQTMIEEELERWPGWQSLPGKVPEPYFARLVDEWNAASVVMVNSEFSKRAVVREGLPPEKVVVIPLAYEPEVEAVPHRKRQGPLKVLWLGQIILRKGIPYLFEAARQMTGDNIEITVAGRVDISEAALKTAPSNLTVVGRVTREDVLRLYAESDVFVLPTLSDGFAITQLEAMARGLPVIATTHCGDVVTPGLDGFLVPIRDPLAIAAACRKLQSDRLLLESMSQAAVAKSKQFGVDRYINAIDALPARQK